MRKEKLKQVEGVLREGGVVVLGTDTIYGIIGLAFKPQAISRIYALRKRSRRKPMIVLVGSLDQLKLFNVKTSTREDRVLRRVWPGKVSIVLKCPSKKYAYLHRGTKTIAFRLPKKKSLTRLLETVGPVVAPSANTEGNPPGTTIQEARKYFGGKVDLYVQAGRLTNMPSTVIRVDKGKVRVLREGAVPVGKLH